MSQDSTLARKTAVSVDEKFDDSAEYKPVTAADVSDENPLFLANLIRTLTSEMRSGFESIRQEIRAERKERDAMRDDLDEVKRIIPLRKANKK